MVNFQYFFEMFLWDLESIFLVENREEKRQSMLYSLKIVVGGIYWFIYLYNEYYIFIGVFIYLIMCYIQLLYGFKVMYLFLVLDIMLNVLK